MGKKFKDCKSSEVAKYESYPLSIKTKIKFLGWKFSELQGLEQNPSHNPHHQPLVSVLECSGVALERKFHTAAL